MAHESEDYAPINFKGIAYLRGQLPGAGGVGDDETLGVGRGEVHRTIVSRFIGGLVS